MVAIYQPKEFFQCREAAIQMLAILCVDHLKKLQEKFDKYIMNTQKSETFQFQTKSMLQDLIEHIDKLAPCAAIYPGYKLDGDPDAFVCTQEKVCHGEFHRTSKRINVPSCSNTKLTKFLENMQYWAGIGYRPTWVGDHTIQYPNSFESELEIFIEEIEFLSRVLPSNYFLTRVAIVQKALLYVYDRRKANNSDYCWICCENLATRQLNGCLHVFCLSCVERLYASSDDQVPVQLNHDQEESSGFLPNIKHNTCPICYKVFSGTINTSQPQGFSKLASKFDYIFEDKPTFRKAKDEESLLDDAENYFSYHSVAKIAN